MKNYKEGRDPVFKSSVSHGGLNESQIKTLEYIRQHEGCQVKQISADMNVPIDTIDKHISVLLKKSLIERRGSKRTGGYHAL